MAKSTPYSRRYPKTTSFLRNGRKFEIDFQQERDTNGKRMMRGVVFSQGKYDKKPVLEGNAYGKTKPDIISKVKKYDYGKLR